MTLRMRFKELILFHNQRPKAPHLARMCQCSAFIMEIIANCFITCCNNHYCTTLFPMPTCTYTAGNEFLNKFLIKHTHHPQKSQSQNDELFATAFYLLQCKEGMRMGSGVNLNQPAPSPRPLQPSHQRQACNPIRSVIFEAFAGNLPHSSERASRNFLLSLSFSLLYGDKKIVALVGAGRHPVTERAASLSEGKDREQRNERDPCPG